MSTQLKIILAVVVAVIALGLLLVLPGVGGSDGDAGTDTELTP